MSIGFHVQQPQARPLDLDLDDDALVEWTRSTYSDEPEFGPIDDFYAARAEHLASRQS